MKNEVELVIPDRRANGDLGDWMHMMATCISTDHRAMNPICMRTEMEYAKIPMADNSQGVGMASKLDS